MNDDDLLRYLIHRYRYEIYPEKKIVDDYPPYLQIEPSSICNYRCVFCFMTDSSFNKKSSGHMGHMSLEMFKNIIDQAEGNIDFYHWHLEESQWLTLNYRNVRIYC